MLYQFKTNNKETILAKILIQINGTEEEIEFETRIGIRKNAGIQEKLHIVRKNGTKVTCLCDSPDEEPLITLAFVPSDKQLTLKRNSHYKHSPECIFYSGREEFYNEKEEKYKSSIFDDSHGSINNGHRHPDENREIARRYAYKHFCIDTLSAATTYAFNLKNKNNESEHLKMFSYKEYFGCLSSLIGKKKMSDGRSPYKSVPENCTLSIGILNQDLDHVRDNILILNEYSKFSNNFRKKEVEISDENLKNTQDFQNIYGNIVNGPYVYIAVYRSYLEDNRVKKMKIVRLLTYAIERVGKSFCFVESDLERECAKNLMSAGRAFIKPVNGYEHLTVGSQYYKKGRPELRYKPDFIVFIGDKVYVVEVCGFPKEKKYMEELRRKEKHYILLETRNQIIYIRIQRGKKGNLESLSSSDL